MFRKYCLHRSVQSRYAKDGWVKTPDGFWQECVFGTQVCDGFWRDLKNNTARRGWKTGERGSETRKRLVKCVREYQWRYWWLHEDRFRLFCKLVKTEWGKVRATQAATAAAAKAEAENRFTFV